ncbi:MAG: YifB family Mg chelatase-like AAA ATPase [Lachnospiraceae bacterium]|nr:YifB family Mg chelatase-like AAA ATPase [Lachnospiraceae bacterium]
MYQSVISGAFRGLDSFLVQVEVDISEGLPCMEMIGYLANEVKESRDRVRVGIKNSGFSLPIKRVTISLRPADIRKDGSGFDLPVAIGILLALDENGKSEKGVEKSAKGDEQEMTEEDAEKNEESRKSFIDSTLIIGELGLDGEVKPVKGILPILLKASKEGIQNCILPRENLLEAQNVKTISLYPADTLRQAYEICKSENREKWNGELANIKSEEKSDADISKKGVNTQNHQISDRPDFSQICGQQQARRAAEIAAAGFHNLLLFGPPGSGKSMIAERIPTILPKMTYEECLEVTQIYSVAGLLDAKTGLITERPYERPHHTITPAALTGGGSHPMPGAITMAHKGVLFLDELPEFGREKLDLLRQPLEEKKIRLIRNQYACDYQCDFMFVAAMNPCPCGFYPDRRKCNCKEHEVQRYLKRVSGPILDRMDISVEVGKIEWAQLTDKTIAESSEEIRARVTAAQEVQLARQGKFNSALSNEELDAYARMEGSAQELLAFVFDKKQLSIRGYQRIRKLARTIADLEGVAVITRAQVSEAVLLNQGMEAMTKREGS